MIGITKKIVIPLLAITVILVTGVFVFRNVYAEETTNFPPLIQRIVEKFGLNADEVKQVMDEERQQRQQQLKTMMEERLNTAVAEGKLTEDQKNALLEKLSEQQKNRDTLRTWAEENGIDLAELKLGFPGHGLKEPGMGGPW